MKKACVIGWPISQSRSPLIHGYWIQKHGVDAIYKKVPVLPDDVSSFISGFQNAGWVGCNVTAPHKETVFGAVATVDNAAKRLGALNTLYIRDGNLCGTNTDGEGFLANLQKTRPLYKTEGAKVVIMGAGGAAKAIIGALVDGGTRKITVINRTLGKIEALQKQFGPVISLEHMPQDIERAIAQCDLFINTTSLGMSGQPPLEFNIDGLSRHAIVSDIVYSPLETPLLKRAKQRGHPTLGGLGMLLHQAVRGFELWFGVRPEVTQELYDLVADDVSKAQN
jgi:shikimate dehydrogenase